MTPSDTTSFIHSPLLSSGLIALGLWHLTAVAAASNRANSRGVDDDELIAMYAEASFVAAYRGWCLLVPVSQGLTRLLS